MKTNSGSDIQQEMKESVFWRRTIIREQLVPLNEKSTIKMMNVPGIIAMSLKMRHLFETENMVIHVIKLYVFLYELNQLKLQMVQDFDQRHPGLKLVIYERWPKVCKLLVEYAEQSGVNFSKKLGILKSRYEFTEGIDNSIYFFYLVHNINDVILQKIFLLLDTRYFHLFCQIVEENHSIKTMIWMRKLLKDQVKRRRNLVGRKRL